MDRIVGMQMLNYLSNLCNEGVYEMGQFSLYGLDGDVHILAF
jgi:hypothetical protein